MQVRNGIITLCSLLAFLTGLYLRDRNGLVVSLDAAGSPEYPLSSGNNDGFILAVGLMSFLFTVLYAASAYVLKRAARRLPAVYLLNAGILVVCVFLVELDSSLLGAARCGDWAPLLGVAAALVPALFLAMKGLTHRPLPSSG